jgi:hypothetical protein
MITKCSCLDTINILIKSGGIFIAHLLTSFFSGGHEKGRMGERVQGYGKMYHKECSGTCYYLMFALLLYFHFPYIKKLYSPLRKSVI